ncbi:MAG: hypothetical protein IKF37_02525 [Bacilli bacterium]|nr:hypothetical protein [Bacilli bacterium]
MKKIIKISLFISLILILSIAFGDRAYAANTCLNYGFECGGSNGGYDELGNRCAWDSRGVCYKEVAEAGYKTSCKDYGINQAKCPNKAAGETADNGEICVFDSYKGGCVADTEATEKAKQEEKLPHCFEYNYSELTCPDEDGSGEACVLSKDGKTCQPKGRALTCEDYGFHDEMCTTDQNENDCAFDDKRGCYTYSKYNVDDQGNSTNKSCKDYSADECPNNDRDECKKNGKLKDLFKNPANGKPCTDDWGNICGVEDGACVEIWSQQDFNAGYELSHNSDGGSTQNRNIVNILTPTHEDFTCSDVSFITTAYLVIRIAAPFLIILFGSLDFFKAMIANDEKKMKEARGKFPKRLIAFILLILLPFVVQFIFSIAGTYGSENICLIKCIATNDTSEKGCD